MKAPWSREIWLAFALMAIPFLNTGFSFLSGISGFVWTLLFPIEALIAVILIVAIVIRLILILLRKRVALRTELLLLIASPGIFILALFALPPPASTFLHGFRYGLLFRISIPEILQTAEVASTLVPNDSLIGPPEIRNRGLPDNSVRWAEFIKRAPVNRLHPQFVVYNRDGTIQLEWGGALTGHWGIRISNDEYRRDRDYGYIPIGRNVAVFSTAN